MSRVRFLPPPPTQFVALTKRPNCADTLSDVDGVSDERIEQEASEPPADFADDLEQLAVVEAELDAAEAELQALEVPPGERDSEPAS